MWNLASLAKLVNGRVVFPLHRDSHPRYLEMEIRGAGSVSYVQENQITFVATEKYLEAFESSAAMAAVTAKGIVSAVKPTIEVDEVESAFAKIVSQFRAPVKREKIGISPEATVSPTARISDDVCIHPGAVVMDNVEIGCGTIVFPNVTIMENCRIGSNCRIFPGATLYENTVIGDRCLLHGGVVIGGYGFGYQTVQRSHRLSAQLGNVVVGSDVEIGSNTTIDRGTYDSTVIGDGTKIDDLVMIAHNCRIGKHNILCSQVGIAGSCQTGDYVVMGGQVGMADHLTIGAGASIGAKSGLMHDVAEGERMFGIPARRSRDEMQLQACRGRLPEMRKALKRLEMQIASLTDQLAGAAEPGAVEPGAAEPGAVEPGRAA